jgi:hypothetical protein
MTRTPCPRPLVSRRGQLLFPGHLVLAVLVLLGAPVVPARAAEGPGAAARLAPLWNRLVGEWVGDSGGQPGQGEGGASFRLELQGSVLLRRSWARLAGPGGTVTSHEDLLLIYRGASATEARAMYWDNEGHTISYAARWSADGGTVTFLSAAVPGAPRFRLVYSGLLTDTPTVSFDVAPPGSPDAFKTHVSGRLRRVASTS